MLLLKYNILLGKNFATYLAQIIKINISGIVGLSGVTCDDVSCT